MANENNAGLNVQYYDANTIATASKLPPAGVKEEGKPAVEIGTREDNMTEKQREFRRKNPWFRMRNYLDTLGKQGSDLDETPRPIFHHRPGERDYALLSDTDINDTNRYGTKIDLLKLADVDLPEDRSLFINGNPEVGDNPNRFKQHGFHFTADNCIGCHACEAACSEKNDNPAHIAFRSVGYVEGGSYPDYKRMNISMACNHCDNPVCMKGCPTKAYTKHAEYGAVLQDPETCFGCGYCTWVCPYNAPQLDPVEGQVSKCNMCVDRLEVGLKPACVSACLGNALNFGVVENAPENRDQIKTEIPGFPSPEITNPNIRFQQTRTMPEEMARTDDMPIKYHQEEDGSFRSVVDEKRGKTKSWNFSRLSSRENPLVLFTLFTQASIGAFMMLYLGSFFGIESLAAIKDTAAFLPLLLLIMIAQAVGLLLSTMHLGKPMRFYRGFNNLRYSPVSREALGVALFFTGIAAYTGLEILMYLAPVALFAFLQHIAAWFAIVSAVLGLYFMYRSYRIPARPFWDHWQVATSFFGTAFSLGSVLVAVVAIPVLAWNGMDFAPLLQLTTGLALLGLLAEGVGLYLHANYLNTENGEGAAAHYIQQTTFGYSYSARNVMLALSVVITAAICFAFSASIMGWLLALLVMPVIAVSLLIGRALFYVLVIPTTMPGAFFWKNKGFEQHARDIGLADMPQVGVVADLH